MGVNGFTNVEIHDIKEKSCDDGITMCKNSTSGLGKLLVFPQADFLANQVDLFGEPNEAKII